MIIFGIGTDIVSVNRIKNSLKNKNFINRIFNEKEILKCKKTKNSINCYAKRFAKKSGKPYISIIGQTKKILNKKFKRKKSKISLSLSDEKKYAVAFVTISL